VFSAAAQLWSILKLENKSLESQIYHRFSVWVIFSSSGWLSQELSVKYTGYSTLVFTKDKGAGLIVGV
jgi:hypothetical protein